MAPIQVGHEPGEKKAAGKTARKAAAGKKPARKKKRK
jgi:hypothetical protein